MLFSHVKIPSFRAKAHLVFHWCLYNKSYLLIAYQSYSDPLENNVCKKPPTPLQIASFWTPLTSEFPLPAVAGKGGVWIFSESTQLKVLRDYQSTRNVAKHRLMNDFPVIGDPFMRTGIWDLQDANIASRYKKWTA